MNLEEITSKKSACLWHIGRMRPYDMFCAGSGKSDVSIMNRNGNVSESYTKTSAIQSAAIAKLKLGVKGELEEFLHDEN